MKTKSIKIKAIQSFSWHFIEYFSTQFVQFFVGIIIARRLLPSDYGLIGMISIFFSISNLLIDNGFGAALIQKKEVTDKDFSTVFFISLLFNVVLYILLYFSSPLIAKFYSIDNLIPVTRLLSLNLILTSFWYIQVVYLTKKLDFKHQTKIKLISSVISGLTGITLAYRNFGILSIIMQLIVSNLTMSLLFWFTSPWKPSIELSFNSFKVLFKFGSKLVLASYISTLLSQMYSVLIGKAYNASELGLFARAQRFQLLTSDSITNIFQRVSFPILSLINIENEENIKRNFRKIMQNMNIINIPLMILLFIIAKPLILLLLTDKWVDSARYLQILSLSGIFYPVFILHLNLLKAKGMTNAFLLLTVVKSFFILISFVLIFKVSIYIFIFSILLTNFISFIFSTIYIKKLIKYSFRELVTDFWLLLFLSGISSLISYYSFYFVNILIVKLLGITVLFYLILFLFGIMFKFYYISNVKDIYYQFFKIRSKNY